MKLDLDNKNIFITGAATGMGRSSAIEVSKHGANVILADINSEGLKEVSEKLNSLGSNFSSVHMDVTSIDDTQKKIFEAENYFDGGINTLIHFAGALEGSMVEIDDLEPETWQRIINLNLSGTYNVVRSVARLMKKRKSGVILLTSSGAGVHSPGSSPAYSASKGGTHGLTFHLQNYLSKHGKRIHDILPGSIRSPLKEGQLKEALQNTGNHEHYEKSSDELGEPDGVAKIVAFIISDEASYLKGSIITR